MNSVLDMIGQPVSVGDRLAYISGNTSSYRHTTRRVGIVQEITPAGWFKVLVERDGEPIAKIPSLWRSDRVTKTFIQPPNSF